MLTNPNTEKAVLKQGGANDELGRPMQQAVIRPEDNGGEIPEQNEQKKYEIR